MTVADLAGAMEGIAPLRFAEKWDNVGLIIGDPGAEATRVLLCIDLTLEVLAEAVSQRCGAIVAYHPPLFEPARRLLAGDVAFEAARRGIAVYSPHTALDVAEGGTNDVLAGLLGMKDVQPLRRAEGRTGICKLVTFAPVDAAEGVAEALFAAGAGKIGGGGEGDYEKCSFRSEGTGTFLPGQGAHPAIGKPGRLERVREIKIETVVPLAHVAAVIAALRAAHPYEQPAFDLVTLAAVPEAVGVGRVGAWSGTLGDLGARVRSALSLQHVLTSGHAASPISRIAVCAGAGRSLMADVIAARADCFITGELPHHDVLRLGRSGIAAICTLHSHSERPVLTSLAGRLEAAGFHATVSTHDHDPLTIA